MKPKVISIITQKGGVGKTTSSIHIGGALAQLNYKVLLIDFDTQCNLSLGYNIDEETYTVSDFLSNPKNPTFVYRGENNSIAILKGSETLKEKNLNKFSLQKAIKSLNDQFDFIIIDCPPKPINEDLSLGEIAVLASDYLISPIRSDKYSLAGIGAFMRSLNSLKANTGVKAELLGFFFNEVEQNTIHFNNYYNMLNESDASNFLLKKYIRKDVNIKNAMDEGKTIFEIKPYGRASTDFKKLTEEILTKISTNDN